jgi:hypothetical protein
MDTGLDGKAGERGLFWRARQRCGNDIKMDRKELIWESVG